jgi:hypothetical protein
MTANELEQCLTLVQAYVRRPWDDMQRIVWANAFDGVPFDRAWSAILAMGNHEDWPTPASFRRHLESAQAGVVTDASGRMFLPGTGWLAHDLDHGRQRPADDEHDDDAHVIPLAQARRLLAQAQRRVTKRLPNGGEEVS